jgi:hypothetical protein
VSTLQITLIVAFVLPALAIVLWPLFRGRGDDPGTAVDRPRDDRRLELEEEKTALYRALRSSSTTRRVISRTPTTTACASATRRAPPP